MSIRDININIVLLVILIVVISFFAGKHLFNVYGVKQPLSTELKAIDGVDTVELIENNNRTDIKVSLKPKVDLYKIYQEIAETSADELGEKKGEILVRENNSSSLNKVYYQIHYAIYEGISTNKFTNMKDNIEKNLNDSDIKYKLWVNNNKVLLRLDGKEKSLYRIVSRNNKGGAENG